MCPGDGCPSLLEGGEEAVGEDLSPLFFGQCPCVSDWRGAIVDNCTTESCGIDTAIFNLNMEKERERERGWQENVVS